MRRFIPLAVAACCALPPLSSVAAQVPAPRPPDSVFLEEFTWDELKVLIERGKKTVIIPTAGTEQKGPHMVMGEHKYALEYTTNHIARALGNAIVAPIITYVPEGSWETKRGHMSKAGTITLPEDRFQLLLTHTARSLKAGGFTNVILIGDSGGNQTGLKAVADALNIEWKGTGARAHFIGDYYTKSAADVRTYLMGLGHSAEAIGSHAGMVDTSELMFINPSLIRWDKLANGGGFADSGVSGDPTKATPELGMHILRIKIDNAVAQIRTSLAAGTR